MSIFVGDPIEIAVLFPISVSINIQEYIPYMHINPWSQKMLNLHKFDIFTII